MKFQIILLFLLLYCCFPPRAEAQQAIPVTSFYFPVSGYIHTARASEDGSRVVLYASVPGRQQISIWDVGADEPPRYDQDFFKRGGFFSPDLHWNALQSSKVGIEKNLGFDKDAVSISILHDSAKARYTTVYNEYGGSTFTEHPLDYINGRLKGYLLGITNEGLLITTEAKHKSKPSLSLAANDFFDEYTGLYICSRTNPDSMVALTRETIKETPRKGYAHMVMAEDQKTLCVYSTDFTEPGCRLDCWSLETGKRRSFQVPVYAISSIQMDARRLLLYCSYNSNSAPDKYLLYDVASGKLLSRDTAISLPGKLYLKAGRIIHCNPLECAVEDMEPKDGHLASVHRVETDTAGLRLSRTMAYHGILLGTDEWMMLPAGQLQTIRMDSARMRGFGNTAAIISAKTGKAELLYTNLNNGWYQEVVTEQEYAAAAAYKDAMANDCPACKGTGKVYERSWTNETGWQQVNFNIYVRKDQNWRTSYGQVKCERCNGTGHK